MKSLITRTPISMLLALAFTAGCTTGTPTPPTPDSGPIRVDGGPPADADVSDDDAGPPPSCTPESMGSTIGDACTTGTDCNDHCFCNGVERCEAGVCVVGPAACNASPECGTASCDEENRMCSFAGDDSMCDDGDPCNGIERCDARTGCRDGAPPTCNDADVCTIDACVPGTGCVFEIFDGDGDGEASRTCGGVDCNDANGAISSGSVEDCVNGIDDDCNGRIDIEDPTCLPTNDTCATALDITPPGLGTFRTRGSTVGFASNATLSCTGTTTDTRRTAPDAVYRFTLTEMRDVTIAVEGLAYNAGILLRDGATCDAGPDLKCSAPSSSSVEPVLHRRRLPAGEYAIFVKTRTENIFTLALTIEAASTSQTDICIADTLDISAGGTFTGALEDDDFDVSCRTTTSSYPEAAHRLVIPAGEFRDVHLTATARSSTGTSMPYVEITSECGSTSAAFSECDGGTSTAPGEITLRGLGAGAYWVVVESTASTAGAGSYTLVAEISPAAGREPGDSCEPLVPVEVSESAPGTVVLDDLDPAPDAGAFCGANRAGYRDAFFQFSLSEPRDVVVRTTSTARHWAAVSSTCGTVASEVDCMTSTSGVAEHRYLRLPAGTHFINVSTLAETGTVRAEITTAPPTPFEPNDACGSAAALVDGTPSTPDLALYTDDADYACGGTDAVDAYYSFTLTEMRFVTLIAEGAASMVLIPTSCTTTPSHCVTGGPPQIVGIMQPGTYWVAVESPPIDAGPVRLRFTTAAP